jgi:hypothetical protein
MNIASEDFTRGKRVILDHAPRLGFASRLEDKKAAHRAVGLQNGAGSFERIALPQPKIDVFGAERLAKFRRTGAIKGLNQEMGQGNLLGWKEGNLGYCAEGLD